MDKNLSILEKTEEENFGLNKMTRKNIFQFREIYKKKMEQRDKQQMLAGRNQLGVVI